MERGPSPARPTSLGSVARPGGSAPALLSTISVLLAALVGLEARLEAQPAPRPPRSLQDMSLEELLTVDVVSASRRTERLTEAPATVLVITREEILDRGYTSLADLFDDLPGMDVVRPWGATFAKTYWRGWRNTIGDPFLLMLDGIVMNHLYYNTADVQAALPLANVERVEVVYGPASSIYGSNAFTGVVNVITRAVEGSGASVSGRLAAGSSGLRQADVTASYRQGDLGLRVTARFDESLLDDAHTERYEYSKARYFADRRLWGGFLDNAALGGAFRSAGRNRAMDARLTLGGVELGFLYHRVVTGYGLEYAADRVQNDVTWSRPDVGAFLRLVHAFTPSLRSTTLLRYRESDVSNDSYFLESANGRDTAGRPSRVAEFSYWQALNSSWSLLQDFELEGHGPASLAFGFRYERKDLQKAYDINSGPAVPVSVLDASTYPYPPRPVDSSIAQNRVVTTDEGGYLQGRLRLGRPGGPASPASHQLHLGLRLDRNTQYGSDLTVRAGWVGDFGAWGAKVLYGEAFQEPNPRVLYGGWTGSGSDPSLEPERSRTVELSGSYRRADLSGLVSFYVVRSRDTIVSTAGGAMNLGDRTVVGADLLAQALVRAPGLGRVRLWAAYTRLFRSEEEVPGSGSSEIGDLAADKLFLGMTAVPHPKVAFTLRGRLIGARTTVATNPVRRVPSYVTLDANVSVPALLPGLGLSLKATNLLDRAYDHPGVREANAGTEPGGFGSDGLWSGSLGYYSSLMPQPGRALVLSLVLDY